METGLIGRITLNIREKNRLIRMETREYNKKTSEKNLRDIGPKKISMSEMRDYILGKTSDIEELHRLKKVDEHLSSILSVCVSFKQMITREWHIGTWTDGFGEQKNQDASHSRTLRMASNATRKLYSMLLRFHSATQFSKGLSIRLRLLRDPCTTKPTSAY